VHEDVINKLAGLKDLKVISRTSVLRFAENNIGLREIGNQLGANYIVEGSVSLLDSQVRVMVTLFDAKTDHSLWSESYDRKLNNVFSLQSDIASEISKTLETKISPREKERLNAFLTDLPEAYDHFIRARALLNASQITYEQVMQSIDFLQHATQVDPGFAEAWGLLSQAQSLRFEKLNRLGNRAEDANLAASESEKALTKAKQAEPEGVAALRAEGYYYQTVKHDLVNALRSFDQALDVFPNDAKTLTHQAGIFYDLGEIRRFVENLEKAYTLENRNPGIIYGLTFAYELTKDYKKMVPFLQRLLELEPEKTHYAIQARYYQFLADGSLKSFQEFEHAIHTIEKTDVYDERAVENNEMVVAMVNNEIDKYAKLWEGKWLKHYAGHGDWACPMIINEEVNQAYFLLNHGEKHTAEEFIQKAKTATSRPINERALCTFDKAAYEPKLLYLTGDSAKARQQFDEVVLNIMKNNRFPRGVVEKSVLLQTADMVAPDRVYALYKEIANESISFTGLEVICANPWTYPNLLKNPEFIKEVRKDGRFIKFLEHFKLIS
jgi:tetratricopeptide (TPR) repeat protein